MVINNTMVQLHYHGSIMVLPWHGISLLYHAVPQHTMVIPWYILTVPCCTTVYHGTKEVVPW